MFFKLQTWFVLCALVSQFGLYQSTTVQHCNIEDFYLCRNSTLSGGGSCCWVPTGYGYCEVCPPSSSPTLRPSNAPTIRVFVPTASPEIKGDPVPVGEHCYCSWIYAPEDETDTMSPTTAPTTAPSHKKDKGGSGSHCGDCECDRSYGLAEMRLQWRGDSGVTNMQWYHDSGMSNEICSYTDLTNGEEFTCNIWDYTDPQTGITYTDFDTNTYFTIEHSTLGSCTGKFHTSCSSDIVSTYAEQISGGDHCAQVYCSGWKDGNPAPNDCDDCFKPCACDNETTTTAVTTTPPEVTPIGEFCYCEDCAILSNTGHCGDCDCDKSFGLVELRMRWYGDTVDQLDFYYKKDYNDKICEFTNLQYGQEFTCHIWEYTDSGGNVIFSDFDTNTYFYASRASPQDSCHGTYHTSCSQDIVGTYSSVYQSDTGTDLCEQVYCTGWKDGNPNDDNNCDDGLYPCSCTPAPTTPLPTSNPNTPKPSKNPTPAPTTSTTEEPTAEPTTRIPTTKQPTVQLINCGDIYPGACRNYVHCCLGADDVCTDDCVGVTPRPTDQAPDPTSSSSAPDPTSSSGAPNPSTSSTTQSPVPTTAKPTDSQLSVIVPLASNEETSAENNSGVLAKCVHKYVAVFVLVVFMFNF